MKNTVTLLIAKIFEKGIMLLFFMIFAREFGKEALGEFSYYYSIVVMLYVLLDLGGEFYQIREFSKKESLRIFNTIFVIKSFLFIILFIILYFIDSNIYILSFFISYYLQSVISIFRSSLYNNGQYILESKYTIIEKIIFLFIVVLNILSLKSLLVMYLAFLASRVAYLFILLNRFYKFKYILNLKRTFSTQYAKKYILDSWSYILHALLVVVFVQIDVVMLKHMGVAYEDIGLYSSALKIYAIAIIFADIIFKQYYPIVAKYVQNNNTSLLKTIILKIQKTNIYFSIYFSIFIMLFAKEIMLLAFGEEFIEATNMLILLSIIIIFRYSMYTYTSILSSSNLNYIKLYTSISCVLINIVLNYILIPIYGVYGAIIATIVTEIVLVISYKVSSFKIIFSNYLSKEEIIALLMISITVYFFMNYNIKFENKLIVLFILVISLALNYKDIKNKLNFKGK